MSLRNEYLVDKELLAEYGQCYEKQYYILFKLRMDSAALKATVWKGLPMNTSLNVAGTEIPLVNRLWKNQSHKQILNYKYS